MSLTFREVNQVSSSCTSAGHLGGSWPSVKSIVCPWPSGRLIKHHPAVLQLVTLVAADLQCGQEDVLELHGVTQVFSSCTTALGVILMTADLQWGQDDETDIQRVNQVFSSCTALRVTADLQWNQEAVSDLHGGESSVLQLHWTLRHSWPSVRSRGCSWHFMGSPPCILLLYYCTWGHLDDSWPSVRSRGCHCHSERSIKCSLATTLRVTADLQWGQENATDIRRGQSSVL